MLNYCIVVDLKGDSGALQCLKTGVLSGLGVGAFTTGVKVPRPGSLVINVIHKIAIYKLIQKIIFIIIFSIRI